MSNKYQKYLDNVVSIAKHAGLAILAIYSNVNKHKVQFKDDDSPLTSADLISNEIINADLKDLTPKIPVLSEEGQKIPFEKRRYWKRYWLIDPLDGTNEFIKRSGEFTVNIALVEKGKPILGVSYAPVRRTCFFACQGMGAFKEDETESVHQMKVRSKKTDKIKIAVSRNIGVDKLSPFLNNLKSDYEMVYFGSSLKLCLVADGIVDVYPRLGSNYEWDTAAGQCIVEEAGGFVVDLNYEALRYNSKESLLNPYFFVIGNPSYNWRGSLSFLRN